MDPPQAESKPHHKKRKHKHKNIEKGVEGGETSGPPTTKIKVPNDAYSFIKPESTASSHISHPPSHVASHPHMGYNIISGEPVGGVIKQHQTTRDILASVAASSFQPVVALQSEHTHTHTHTITNNVLHVGGSEFVPHGITSIFWRL